MVTLFLFSLALYATVYYASLTSAAPFLVKKSVLGTAWGIVGSSIGFVQCIIPLCYIFIIQRKANLAEAYSDLTLFSCGLIFITTLFAAWIFIRDYKILDTKYIE